MSVIAVIGAGKTGRGFLARLLAEAHKEILFIDKNKTLVDALNAAGSFTVDFFGNVRAPFRVDGFRAVTWENADLSAAELLFVSVGGGNLPAVGAALRTRLADGKKRRIIVAENASHPAKTLSEAIGLDTVAVSESTVFCTTIENGALDISSENYPYLQCDAAPFAGYDPAIAGVRPVDGFENFLTRKLYTYNAASCVIAYLGYIKGYTDYGAAANDPEILALCDRNYAATNRVLCRVYGYTEADQAEFAALSRQKFTDRTIKDTVARNAREPQRKLRFGERIVGPLCLLDEQGEDTAVLLLTAAAALLYENEGDAAWHTLKEEHPDPADLVSAVCGLAPHSRLSDAILARYNALLAYDSASGAPLPV